MCKLFEKADVMYQNTDFKNPDFKSKSKCVFMCLNIENVNLYFKTHIWIFVCKFVFNQLLLNILHVFSDNKK